MVSNTALRMSYRSRAATAALGCICFGTRDEWVPGLRIDTGLQLLPNQPLLHEMIGQHGRVAYDAGHDIHYARHGDYLLASVTLNEQQHGGITAVTTEAYRRLHYFNAHSGYPHVVRIWNYLDDINAGSDDQERYKLFCTGRAHSWPLMHAPYPAASAIGRQHRNGLLLVYWLACREPAMPLENPRQISAYHYPREHGPNAPGFARASLLSDGQLLISGTASIVGHASQHPGDVVAQTHEVLNNLEALIAQARHRAVHLPAALGTHSLLKVYVRHAEHAPAIENAVRTRYPSLPHLLMLGADICRRELLLEVDCVHGLIDGAPAGQLPMGL